MSKPRSLFIGCGKRRQQQQLLEDAMRAAICCSGRYFEVIPMFLSYYEMKAGVYFKNVRSYEYGEASGQGHLL